MCVFCGAFEALYGASVRVIDKGRHEEYDALVAGTGAHWRGKRA